MSTYRHTQIGYLLIIIDGVLVVVVAVLAVLTGFSRVMVFAMMFLAIALTMFYSLTVFVDDRFIVVEFYLGIPRRSFSLANVVSFRVAQSPWYYGWGVRYTPRGWIFRVSGFSVVEIELANGKYFQIGTDEPDVLAKAIGQALEKNIGDIL